MKNRNGRGSITLRKDGRYQVRISDPRTGKRVSRYTRTKKEAEDLLDDMRERRKAKERVADKPGSVAAFAEAWMANRIHRGRKPSTVGVYVAQLRNHVLPTIGAMPLADVTAADIEDVLEVMKEAGLSTATIASCRATMSAMFKAAAKAELRRGNPVADADLPNGVEPPKRRQVPSDAEVIALLQATNGTDIGAIATVLAHTGARVGEVLALRFTDLDLAAGEWTVARTITRDVAGRSIEGDSTKTSDPRVLVLAGELVALLRARRKTISERALASPVWLDADLVFPTSAGTIRDPRNTMRELRRLAPEWPYGWHELRHWAVSTWIAAGLTDTLVAKLAGHRSVATTRDVYAHLLDGTKHAATDATAKRLSG